MGLFLLSVTIVAAALFRFIWKDRLRHVAAWWNRTPIVRDRAFGLCELYLPDGWRPGRDLNERAGIEAIDPLHSRYVWIISESRNDFDARMGLEEHSASTRESLLEGLHGVSEKGPEHVTVSGFPAVQFEIEAVYKMIELKYLHTTIGGRRAFHQVLAWSTRSGYDRQLFDKVLQGFRETPGPDPEPREHPPEPMPSPQLGFRPPTVH